MPNYEVITIGDAKVDAFLTIFEDGKEIRVDEKTNEFCMKFGDKIDVKSCTLSVGGNAANVAIGLSRLGIRTALAAEFGDDELSPIILGGLDKENIDKTYIIKTPHTPSSLTVGIDFQQDRTLFVHHVKRQHKFHFSIMRDAKLVYLTSLGEDWETPYRETIEMLNQSSAILAFNPGSLQLHTGKEMVQAVMKRSDILFLNKEEAELLLFNEEAKDVKNSQTYILSLMQQLQKQGPKTIVITNGANGAYALDEQGKDYFLAPIPVVVVEKTGAGDAFTTGFLAAWYTRHKIEDAMGWGARNAASVIGKVGAEAGLLTLQQITQ